MTKKIKSVDLLPEFLRTDKNSKFLSSTIDQLIEPPQLERIDGFIGSKLTPTFVPTTDNYIPETLSLRRNYQLEPALVIKDSSDNIKEVKAIDDLANEIVTEGGVNNNFDRLFRSEFYSYNPHIDWDKFVNYQNYYWLTTGPELITITGGQTASVSTYSVVDNALGTSWIFNPNELTEDPVITLYRGNTYEFNITSSHNFYVKIAPSLGTDDLYQTNVLNNGTNNGVITIVVDDATPDALYYTANDNPYFQGQFVIRSASENSRIDVDKEIIGKQSYQSGAGVQLSNGMKVSFTGEVYPVQYRDKEFFVEGVGTNIQLIDYDLLVSSESLSATYNDNFDAEPFDDYPFDSFKKLPIDPEYVTINRGSVDLNPWSRYNRWVHGDIIAASAAANGLTPTYPLDKRAKRPIIEFSANLKLFNFGTKGIGAVDFIDTSTTDAFSIVEGSYGYYVDTVQLEQGNTVIFNADADAEVRGRIYQVNFVTVNSQQQIQLVPVEYTVPESGYTIIVNSGNKNAGTSWWYNGSEWQFAQQHSALNQAPLFDLFDATGTSYSDATAYNSSFTGNKIFGYDIGTVYDSVLGLNIKYKSNATTGVGSWMFKNYFSTDSFSIFENSQSKIIPSSNTFLKFLSGAYANVWTLTDPYVIPVIELHSPEVDTDRIQITSIDNIATISFDIDVYVNNKELNSNQFSIVHTPGKVFVDFATAISANSSVYFKIYSTGNVNDNGWYETPLGLTNNPLNGSIQNMTFTELSDHLDTMIDMSVQRNELSLGNISLRDIPDISKYGNRLISNVNPMAFANFFLGIKEHSVTDSIVKAGDQYNQFKMAFLKKITELDVSLDPISAVDVALKDLNKDKDINSPWHFSDMTAYGQDKTVNTWTITDVRNTKYPLTSDFDITSLANRSVIIYIDNNQLIVDRDYQFIDSGSGFELLIPIAKGNVITVNEYSDTTGSYIPSTPTKLGLYPKYQPSIFLDKSYANGAVNVIQGHDGSITVAYNDYRDSIILELEKRIFNNIKSEYRPELLDINDIIPGAFRSNKYSVDEVNTIIQQDFIKWAGFYGIDAVTNYAYDVDNSLTWNYVGSYNTILDQHAFGNWRAMFKYYYDTDRPNTHPWEMLGFGVEPTWWKNTYGPAPYTSGNTLLWKDLEEGKIKYGDRAGIDTKYARPLLSQMLPVNEYGELILLDQDILTNITAFSKRQDWKFGDQGAAETAWRRSSYWPFVVQRLLALTQPSTYSSVLYDPSRITKNIAGQWTYGNEGKFLNLRDIAIFDDANNTLTDGFSVYISEIGRQRNTNYLTTLKEDLSYVNFNLFHKVGGFISKKKIQVIIDAVAPNSTSPGSLLPQEDYKLLLNVSNPVRSTNISGIIIQKSGGSFIIKGYDKFKPYFNIYQPVRNSGTPIITVGGISASYINWEASSTGAFTGLSSIDTTTAVNAASSHFYPAGQIVKYGNVFYRVKSSHIAEGAFNSALYEKIPVLPISGGATVQKESAFDSTVKQIPYGYSVETLQEVYDIIIGYGKWLESQGFIFDEYNADLNSTIDWNLSGKEFLYWTTQKWADNSIITLSPFADRIKYTFQNTVVDSVFDSFYNYSLLTASGTPFPQRDVNVNREDGVCTIQTINTTDGIYFATINSIQKEHAMVFNNSTIFNDTIYDIETGYRQRRMRLSGFRTSGWQGDYFSPGFIFDEAVTSDWKKFASYHYGDVVRFTGNYYSATKNVKGKSAFNVNDGWVLLGSKPVAELLPNFDYKINQFEDFYSLDIDNFDVSQQRMAQHLIGYTPRVYLNNIFTNPIAQYKFYQGFIKEKGTKNAVNRIAKATIYNLQGEISFAEEWAFRIGNYGSFESNQELEFPLNEGTFIENPQILSFVDTRPVTHNDLINYVTPGEIVISPTDFVPSTTFATTSTDIFKLGVAGYVNLNDVAYQVYDESAILNIADNRTINEGDVFWLGFTASGDWDVLRYERIPSRVISVDVTSPADEITFTTNNYHGVSAGDIISISQFDSTVDGIYRITDIPALDMITVASDVTTVAGVTLPADGSLFKFVTARSDVYDNLPSDQQMLQYPVGTKFWLDNDLPNDNNWIVYEKSANFASSTFAITSATSAPQLGYSISRQTGDGVIAVGAPSYVNLAGTGSVFIYTNEGATISRRVKLDLNLRTDVQYDDGGDSEFGASVYYTGNNFNDSGYGILITGAPGLSGGRGPGTSGIRAADSTLTNSSYVQEGAIKLSRFDQYLFSETDELVLLSPTPANFARFGHAVSANTSSGLMLVGAPGTTNTGTGAVYAYTIDESTSTLNSFVSTYVSALDTTQLFALHSGTPTGSQFGYSIASSNNGIHAVGAPGFVKTDGVDIPRARGAVVIYTGTTFTQLVDPYSITDADFNQEVTTYGRFGDSVLLSKDGGKLFVSMPGHKNKNQSYGAVFIYTKNAQGLYASPQILTNPVQGQSMKFGQSIDYNEDTETLVISSIGTNNSVHITIDNNETTFDSASTKFSGTAENFGTVYVYNKKSNGTRYILAEELQPIVNNPDIDIVQTRFGTNVAIDGNNVYVGAPGNGTLNSTSKVYQFAKTIVSDNSLRVLQKYQEPVDIDIMEKIALYDVYKETVIEYLDLIDPLKGKIAGLADEELKFKSSFDPATYSTGNSVTTNDVESNWLDSHVGELWWDLSTVKYMWYEQGDLLYRKNNWGRVFPGSSIDVYEWVESEYLPSQWAILADTVEGLSTGISGQPKYPDDSVMSVRQSYDYATNSFTNVYYFWVKNKVTVPNTKNRRISAYQVHSIINDPTSYGLKYLSVIDKNSIILSNINSLLVNNRIHLNLSYDNIKNTIPKHTEWLLLQEGVASSRPNTLLEKKLIDSLLGHDSLGNPVPDPSLSARTKYGISIRPRQGLFKDRRQALRNIVEFANGILASTRVTGNYNFVNLNQQESAPDIFSHAYDEKVEDNESLLLVDTLRLKQAKLSCTVENGKIRSVVINDPGFGYKISPSVSVTGATIETEIDSFGRVISCSIIDAGKGFVTPPNLVVRPYTVVVLVDSVYNGKWSEFVWDQQSSKWTRFRTQQYNTNLYWDYIDWTSTDYNKFIDYSYTVNDVYQLNTLTDLIPGQYVKVKDGGDGRYIILAKTASGEAGSFDTDFNLVYSENGTIQISDSIWDSQIGNLGYDDIDTRYDQTLFDQTPDKELQYIINALRDDLFVNELKVNWNLLFFKAVRYALTEQKLLDWAFKTSFINVTNYAGSLDQRPIYKLQDSKYYEDYLKEVKPYHTQIRSYTTNYTVVEPTQTYTSDFDLPPQYNSVTGVFEPIAVNNTLTNVYPWKSWADNYLYGVGSISIGIPGDGYIYAPEVVIETAEGDSGSGATAVAYITSGKVSSIVITNAGTNYSKPPKVRLVGGTPTVPALLYAQLYNGKIRSNTVGMKFDRISKSNSIGDLTATDTFLCNGSNNEYTLTWLAEPNKAKISIILEGDVVAAADYKIENYTLFYNGYNKEFSKIVFVNIVPPLGRTLTISYAKNIELFNATERILTYYNPTAGMPGVDLPQLMDGIEYPKTTIDSLPFGYTAKWDVAYPNGIYSKFGEFAWAESVGFYTQIAVATTATVGTRSVVMTSTNGLVVGQSANIISTVTNKFNTSTEVKITAIDTLTNRVSFDASVAPIVPGELIEFWGYDNSIDELDSAIDGGDFGGTYALGINPEDIIIDGDSFISANTSYAPDELVPGFVTESIGINVYTKDTGIVAPTVISNSFEIAKNTVTTSTLSIMPPNDDSITVTFNRKLFNYSSSTAFTTITNSTLFSINWATNQMIIGPQSAAGKVGYTIISIGSAAPTADLGLIDSEFTVTNHVTNTNIQSLAIMSDVKSAYVTVNGTSIPKVTTSTDYGYMLSVVDTVNHRASVSIYNMATGTNAIQAWFFGNDNHYFNEIREQTITYQAGTANYTLTYPPGNIEPVASQAIVELVTTDSSRILMSPIVSYYQVTDINTLEYNINNRNVETGGTPSPSWEVRVYLNGGKLTKGTDWSRGDTSYTLLIRSGILKVGDVIAILIIPQTPSGVTIPIDYDIQGTTLSILQTNTEILPTGSTIRVITYTDHDNLLLRTERFNGEPNRRFKISRPVVNDNYIWVTINGIPLINRTNFVILDDQQTIEISDYFNITSNDIVVITSMGTDKFANAVLGYRVFTDIFNRTQFRRLSKAYTTELASELTSTSTSITVKDASVLKYPIISKKIPGVVIIDGERIEFYKVRGNVLSQLRRSTFGTGSSNSSPIGTKVIDQSNDQTIPFEEKIYKQTHWTLANTSTYVISKVKSKVTIPVTKSITTTTIVSDGITLQKQPVFNSSITDPSDVSGRTALPINPADQITVIYGGHILSKSSRIVHDTTVSYDSQEYTLVGTVASADLLPVTYTLGDAYVVEDTNRVWVYEASLEKSAINGYVYKGLTYLPPEFTVDNTGTTQLLTLNIPGGVQDDIKLEIIKKEYNTSNDWNTPGTSLLESTTKQAAFIRTSPAELPDRYYYGR